MSADSSGSGRRVGAYEIGGHLGSDGMEAPDIGVPLAGWCWIGVPSSTQVTQFESS